MKALLKRVIDGGLRRLGLVRTAMAAAQTVDAIYLNTLGRAPDLRERAEGAAALKSGTLSIVALIDRLSSSAEGKARLWDAARPAFLGAGYVEPQAHVEQIVEIVFLAVLGRRPESEALSAYAGALRSGKLSADAFVVELSSTQEAAARLVGQGYLDQDGLRAQIVDVVFLTLLGRPPEAEARAAYAEALRSGALTINTFISEIASPPEAELRALERLRPVLERYGYVSQEEHYSVVADAIFRSILGRPLDDPERVFARNFIGGHLTLETAIEQLLNSEEVRVRIRQLGLPDVLEGIYRTLMGAPETDPALRGLIRSVASQRTFEMIKTMSLSAEAHHYLMQPIIKAHRQQFLAAATG